MSKGDDVWGVREMVLLLLYDEGAFHQDAAVQDQRTLLKTVKDRAKQEKLDVSAGDIHQVFLMLFGDGLISGLNYTWHGPLWLTHEGFREARGIAERRRGNSE